MVLLRWTRSLGCLPAVCDFITLNHNDSRIVPNRHFYRVFNHLGLVQDPPSDHPTDSAGASPLHTFFPQAPGLTSEFPVAGDDPIRNGGVAYK